MTREEVIRLAKEAGCIQGELAIANVPQLERFAELVAAAERERCIIELDRNADKPIEEIVSAIRAMEDQ